MSFVRAASVTARVALAKRAAPLAPVAFAGVRGLAVHAARTGGAAGGAGRATASALPLATIGIAAAGLTAFVAADASVDYDAVRKAIADMLDVDGYDDGSYGPVLVRLAWHASGTYDKSDGTGGSNGATMRFKPESTDGANAGLDKARAILEPIKAKFPGISYADLWTLAGCVAIEEMGGPKIAWRPGRSDEAPGTTKIPPNGRLPDAAQGASHVRDVFYRQGFNDREIVALAGAHALGRCHANRSGFEGPWTNAPTTFSNEYFRLLLEEGEKWAKGKVPATGNVQYYNKDKTLIMLPADIEIARDPAMRKYVELYAKDEDTFNKDFAAAFKKLIENGVPFPAESKTLWQRIFG